MALSPGTQIGPYQIIDKIGAGGMGEVYRATDTKLGRDIAIKTLPSALAQEPDRFARFEREAKLLATLNHAHIGAIYGLDEHEGAQFIAMELVEGQTLEEKLKDGALPVEAALRIALQIAEALEAAHEKGVMHRDLKPANIMLTPDGVVKVLDFGLAKAFSGDPNEASPAHSPALSMAMTQQGLILGTAGYMSPEQASGQATDQRADIWAFGVVLYEMLTALPLFSGESVPHVLAAVLQTEPDWNRLPKDLPGRLKLLLERCLEKKVRNRYHSIADVRIEIEKALTDPHDVVVGQEVAIARHGLLRPAPVAIAAAVAALVGLAGGRLWPDPASEPPAVVRFDYVLPAGHVLRPVGDRPVMALSPDGRHFVYDTADGIYLRAMGELDVRLIPGTEPPLTSPVVSPDGQWVAYWDGAQLRRIAISGGAAAVIADSIGNPAGMNWEEDGTILFGQGGGIYRVSANGGLPELIVPVDDGRIFYSPELLPDGDSLIFTSWSVSGDLSGAQVEVQSLSTGERDVLVAGGGEARYVPTGHLIYTRADGSLFAIAFDPETLSVSGGPVPLLQGVVRIGATGFAKYAVSEDGTLVYATGTVTSEIRELVWVDREGREEPIDAPARAYTSPRLSPDGTKVALNPRDQDQDIWVWDLVRETLTRLTFDPGQDRQPVWFPDSTRIAYASQQAGAGGDGLFWRTADGTGQAQQLAQSGGEIFPQAVLPDATAVIVYGDFTGANSNEDIAIVRLDGDAQTVVPLLHTTFNERFPDVSPDGRWLAYASNESGAEEVYVRPFPDVDAGGRWQVSTNGGTQPRWASNSTELFYRNGNAIMTVPVETEPSFAAGNPTVVFEGQYAAPLGGRTYDVSLDGERFLMLKEVDRDSEPVRIVVVRNWFEELRRLVPTN